MVNKQRGFTLVEIAIVLVIIGLLLGGILKGQELITAARVRNLADQARAFRPPITGLLDRYRAVPGDMLPAQACAAIGNHRFNRLPARSRRQWESRLFEEFSAEAAAAWLHIAASGFLQGSYSGTAANAAAYTTPSTPPAAPTNPWNGFLLLGRSADYIYRLLPPQPPRLHLIMGRYRAG